MPRYRVPASYGTRTRVSGSQHKQKPPYDAVLWYAGLLAPVDQHRSLPRPFPILDVVLSFLLDLGQVLARSDRDKTVELVLLRQQLRLYERQARQPRPSRWAKVALASLAAKLPDLSRVALTFPVLILLANSSECRSA